MTQTSTTTQTATACASRTYCQTTVEVTVEAEGYIGSFAVVALCDRMASTIWDAFDSYGIPSDAPYTVTPHVTPRDVTSCCGVSGGHCAC